MAIIRYQNYKLQNKVYEYILNLQIKYKKNSETNFQLSDGVKIQFDENGYTDFICGTESVTIKDDKPVIFGSLSTKLTETARENINKLKKHLLFSCGIKISEEDFEFYE